MTNLLDDRTALYRLFGADEALLYVGISNNPTNRFTSHRATKPWWMEVVDHQVTWHQTRDAAAAAEVEAIRTEAPRYNRAIPDKLGRYSFIADLPASTPDSCGDEVLERRLAAIVNAPARQPLYARIADDLHRRIQAGEFPPGSPLPSEPDLGTEYGLGLQTVRNAIDLLVLRGLVVKRHGARTRVRETVPMSVAPIPPGHRVRARAASDEERREWALPPGAHVLVVVEAGTGLEVETYPADRFELEPGHPD